MYTKQNFSDGDVLYAADLNEMDDVIASSDEALQFKEVEPYIRNLTPVKKVPNYLYHVHNKVPFGPGGEKAYQIFDCSPGTYYITGATATNNVSYPLCAFYDSAGELLYAHESEQNTYYTDEEVTAPAGSETLVVNCAQLNAPIAAKQLVTSTGSEQIDGILDNISSMKASIKSMSTPKKNTEVEKGVELTATSVVEGKMYGVVGKTEYTKSNAAYAFFDVKGLNYYFVSGASATNGFTYSLCAFYDDKDNFLDNKGTDTNTVYNNELVMAPAGAVKMVVNRSRSDATIKVVTGVIQETSGNYSLDVAETLIRLDKRNPFMFKTFDKGYVTFVFDDLLVDLDSIASIFSKHNAPFCIAAIADRLDVKATYLQESAYDYTPGMAMRDIMATAVSKGAEIMTHNSSPVVTQDNQYDYDFMWKHFVQSKKRLQAAGFNIRGLIRAGGAGVISGTQEIEKWLIGNYEYANQGTATQYTLDRISITQPIADIKAAIDDAVQNHKWIRFMCHGYDFDGTTFTGPEDLEEILLYALNYVDTDGTLGIVTYADMFDRFGSSLLQQNIGA